MANTTEIDIKKQIFVKNAHLNNLKHIDVLIPKKQTYCYYRGFRKR